VKTMHTILRGARRTSSAPLASGPAIEMAAESQVRIEFDDLDRREVAMVRREEDVIALAPAMPMRLVDPADAHATAPGESGDVAWGVKAVRADTAKATGAGVVVAVLDTGIAREHQAFAGLDIVRRNFTAEADDDLHGHGTHCAGTIFGRRVGGVRIGVAPGVPRALIGKVLGAGGGSSDRIVEAMLWAAGEGADVISMSLGMDFPGYARRLRESGMPEELAVSRALEGYRANVMLFERLVALLHARPKPTLVVAAAGNESRRELDLNFEIAVSPPATSVGIVSVAALGRRSDGSLGVARFSNTGASISGPGVEIVSAGMNDDLQTMSGTSMAAPHVAGVAALWAQRLREQGNLTLLNLTGRLIGQAVFHGLQPGIDPADVGAGLAIAPQE
jgi:subtilisin family serine protease